MYIGAQVCSEDRTARPANTSSIPPLYTDHRHESSVPLLQNVSTKYATFGHNSSVGYSPVIYGLRLSFLLTINHSVGQPDSTLSCSSAVEEKSIVE